MNKSQIAFLAITALLALSFTPTDAQWYYSYYYPTYSYGYGNYYYPSYNWGYNSYYYPSYGYYYGKRSADFANTPRLQQQAPLTPQNPQQ
ncbi:hypothetical protein QR680_004843 [Steinernema hermaphroditum]|uniref:Uncharacterized protein n=1 Tax=Steinernema hermaphroditum TaxID=289476 RepID=A0AA39HSB8_9BILA|nr:hypothetical protein QR680_004843 [Steinernema hermaphroditum]